MRARPCIPHYAVMGNPIAHSLSPLIYQQFSEQTGIKLVYDKIEATIEQFEPTVLDFFETPTGKGLNITLPFKERAYAMASIRTPRCSNARAANTLWIENQSLHADNTDGVGLMRDLNRHIDVNGKRVLLLGAGGAARGVIGELLKANPQALTLSNRTLDKAKILEQQHSQIIICELTALTDAYDVIINATAASLHQQTPAFPRVILENHPFCYDLAYRQSGDTAFVQWAKSFGAKAIDGIGMLIEQAAEAFYIWHGVRPDTSHIQLHCKD